MSFLIRLIEYATLGIVTFAVVLAVILLVLLIVNRGLQYFFEMFGYEVGDFFGWTMKKLGFKKIEKNDKEKGNIG